MSDIDLVHSLHLGESMSGEFEWLIVHVFLTQI